MSNPSQDQKRNPNLKSSNVASQQQGAYSASPSQLTIPSDLPSAPGLPNPYHQPYAYVPSPHDPSSFAFHQQSAYRPPLPPHLPPQPQHIPQQSPSNPQPPQNNSNNNRRKRRPSELNDPQLQGPPPPNPNHYGPSDLDVNLGPPPPQQQPPAQPSPAPPKKARTNTPWTPAEEQRLKAMRDAGNSWSEIAKTFPTRTEGSVKKHWYKDMHYAEFAEDESAALLQAIKDYESNKWKVIGQKVGKPAKACEQFAKEQGWKV